MAQPSPHIAELDTLSTAYNYLVSSAQSARKDRQYHAAHLLYGLAIKVARDLADNPHAPSDAYVTCWEGSITWLRTEKAHTPTY